MKNLWREVWEFLNVCQFCTVVVFATAAGVGLGYGAGNAQCHARWASTAPAQYSLFGGCRVLMPDGRWIPEDQFRLVDFTEIAP